jgi:glutathione S-transferase
MNKSDGVTPHYTLPAIYDPITKTGLTDSLAIALYLDAKYPDTPKLIPEGTLTFHKAWGTAFNTNLDALWQFVMPKVTWALNEPSAIYFRKRMLGMFKVSMEELYPAEGSDKRKEEWKKLEDGFGRIANWYGDGSSNEDNTTFVFIRGGEDQVCFADMALGGFIIWIRILFGRESEEWKDVEKWHGGRWGRMMKALEKYE